MTGTLTASLNGITDIPAGHIATIKTYLAMRRRPRSQAARSIEPYRLERLRGADLGRYLSIFATLGRRWLWWSRLQLEPDTLASMLDTEAIEAYAINAGGADAGLLELDFRAGDTADLAFLGLFEGHTGKGVGTIMIGEALARLWRKNITTVTINTCTFDHPAALGLYRRAGFDVLKQAVEIVPDPRACGLLPREAAPHVPLLA